MTATDRLRALLDERGVEWWNETDPDPQTITMARTDGQLIEYHENANGSTGYHIFNMRDLTPEQAVEATLGRGTCRVVSARIIDHGEDRYETELSCGHVVHLPPEDFDWCPNCGRRVSQGEEEG